MNRLQPSLPAGVIERPKSIRFIRGALGQARFALFCWLALVGTLAAATPAVAQNILVNPGFESVMPSGSNPWDIPTSWSFFVLPSGGMEGYYSISTGDPIFPGPETFSALEGARAVGQFSQGSGGEYRSITYQQFATTAGESFRLSGSAFLHPNQPLPDARHYGRLEITFFDSSFSMSATQSSAPIDLSTPQEQWSARAVEGTAPPWATLVQARMLFVACEGETSGCFGGGTIFWDDLSFDLLPPPPVPFGSSSSVVVLLVALTAVAVGHARRSGSRATS